MSTHPLLESIDSPADLRRLPRGELPQLSRELRAFLLNSVAQTGGHLSSNLGTVELTVALHYVFDTPRDRIVWDVGHQTYAHKILTGRRKQMDKLRQWGGPAGFPRRSESEYDTFGTAHSSTSISAALGMAIGARIAGDSRHVVAVIGDGAMSAGMAFEALNNARGTDILVVLNDNEMSISEPVGAINQYFAKMLSSRLYNTVRRGGKEVLSMVPPMHELARRAEEHMKGMVLPGTLFEEFGFNYIGPIDGHDVDALVNTLSNIRDLKGAQFLHVVTKKGYGYPRAEADPILYHGVTKFDPAVGMVAKTPASPPYTQVFGDWLCDMAAADPKLVAITPAMREGSGLVRFSQAYPARYFDVGIAEQHAVTFAAGLACEGMKPVVAIYSTFLQRAYDQLIHDVVLQDLPVVFAIDRAGVVGADGPTHIGAFDLTYLRCLPNTTVMTPSDENECRQMLTTAFRLGTPAAVRYPRGSGPGVAIEPALSTLPVGKGEIRREGRKRARRIAILAFGSMLHPALAAAETIDATVANMR
ncbi:MAG: 1-deoxy-D-xylulose-5-phosphate synthase, partial [Casimicrobiaceae bacterium]